MILVFAKYLMNSVTRIYDGNILTLINKISKKISMADSQQSGLSSVKITLFKEGCDNILIKF